MLQRMTDATTTIKVENEEGWNKVNPKQYVRDNKSTLRITLKNFYQ
jgi:hypothetical protein